MGCEIYLSRKFRQLPVSRHVVRLSAMVMQAAVILLFGVLGGDQFIYFQF